MAARGYEFYLRVLKVSLTISEEILSALEDKIRIPARPCNVLFILFILTKFQKNRPRAGSSLVNG